jgi:tetratricopeptide (TPR) repeat protein
MNRFDPEPALSMPLVLDDRPGPAPRITRERAAAMVDAALHEFDGAQAVNRAVNKARARRKTLVPLLSIAASVLLGLVGVAAAARFYFHFNDSAPTSASAPTQANLPRVAQRGLPAPESLATPAPVSEAPAEPVPLRAAVKPGRVSAPEDLLQKANHLRADGQFREAAQTYALVYERFPKSLSAYVARVAAAAIQLEHLSNPTLARRLYEQALREQAAGALDLEARQGLSVALRDLEDRPAEVRTLQGLMNAHPDSPAARRAQVRLREIDGSSP